MPVNASNPFKWRDYPGDFIIWCVRWYLRFPISFAHMAEMALESGLLIHPSCIWRWVQVYRPELDKRCRVHLKRTNKSYGVDETYIKVKGVDQYLYRAGIPPGRLLISCSRPNATQRRPSVSSVRPCLTQPIRNRGSSTQTKTGHIRQNSRNTQTGRGGRSRQPTRT